MLELYRLPGCPYCAKVEDKLDELDLEYETHTVLPFRFLQFEVKSVSGQSGVPVLVDPEHGVEAMAESDDVVTAVTARKPTGFSRGRRRVGYAKQPTDYSSADSRPLYKTINKE